MFEIDLLLFAAHRGRHRAAGMSWQSGLAGPGRSSSSWLLHDVDICKGRIGDPATSDGWIRGSGSRIVPRGGFLGYARSAEITADGLSAFGFM